MELHTQFNIIFISLIFGFLFSLFYNISYKLLHHKKIVIKIISNIIFTFLFTYIYFICLQRFCYGIFHIYSILLIIVGYLIEIYLGKAIENATKK